MEAGKSCDAYGLMPGNVIGQSDAEQAYIQARLGGDVATWVRLERSQWPKAWAAMRDPVVPLKLALYGHPDAGGYWERHCETQLRSVGFVPIPDWRSCFWHAGLRLFLVVYVDVFKMSGPQDNMAKGWALIRKHIRTDPPQGVGKYRGCEHIVSLTTLDGIPTEDLTLLVLPQAADDAPSLSVRGGGPPKTLGPKPPTSRVRASKGWNGR
jgi:hypothetical protein